MATINHKIIIIIVGVAQAKTKSVRYTEANAWTACVNGDEIKYMFIPLEIRTRISIDKIPF